MPAIYASCAWVIAGSALASPPLMCDPKEDPIVCSLKQERNNALDELAVTDGNARRDRDAAEIGRQALEEYWKNYLRGLEDQRSALSKWWEDYWSKMPNMTELKSRIAALCDWKGTMTVQQADLCRFWEGDRK